MKRYVKAESLVDEFLEYHEDPNAYHANPEGFDKMYEILSKYGDESENVDVVFQRAPLKDQRKMIQLIRYDKPRRVGESGYCKQLYNKALMGEAGDTWDYCNGISDAFQALFQEGLLPQELKDNWDRV